MVFEWQPQESNTQWINYFEKWDAFQSRVIDIVMEITSPQ